MTELLDFFASNYIWLAAVFIVSLLAIIGYYADKTNFGQGQINNNDSNPNNINLGNVRLADALHQNKKEEPVNAQQVNQNNITQGYINNSNNTTNQINQNGNFVSPNQINQLEQLTEGNNNLIKETIVSDYTNNVLKEQEVIKFNNEFDSILPKKEFIDSDLLSDIDDLELGKTQKIDLTKVPDLDDIELPNIGGKDIWKF